MHISEPFIKRPVGTMLLALAVLLAGTIAYRFLPVAALPEVDFPTIQVGGGLPGASPATMASSVATPLERQFGRIAGVTQMTSTSMLGSTNITLQFDLNRNIDAAARDVQAAINASAGQLPAGLPSLPTYRKVNPADSPILFLAMTSDTMRVTSVYDVADSIVVQKIAQVPGVGQVNAFGGAKPAVRISVNPTVLANYGVGLDTVRAVLGQVNSNEPKGQLSNGTVSWVLGSNSQLFKAEDYRSLIIAYRNGAPVRLGDIGDVQDSVENLYTVGYVNNKPAVLIVVNRQPGANIIDTVDRVKAILPGIRASIPPTINLAIEHDRTQTIRASVKSIQETLLLTIVLVIFVIFVFLRNFWSTVIPAIAVPVSLIATFGLLYLFGYSVDNLSLMALAIATGFVVDDAIVVIENITRYIELGLSPIEAALKGSQEIGFTVLSMSTSLVAVFIPILLMGGIVGRVFREFAVTLSIAIGVSLLVSLTVTPMMCARFLKPASKENHNWLYRANERSFNALLAAYARGVRWVLRHQPLTLGITIATVCLSVVLYYVIPKGFFPLQDVGAMGGAIQAAQDMAFDSMKRMELQFGQIVLNDPAVEGVTGFVGGGAMNTGTLIIHLKSLGDRNNVSVYQVIDRLRRKVNAVPGAMLYLQAQQDISVGGRQSNSQFQLTMESEDVAALNEWAPIVFKKMQTLPELRDVATDQQVAGLQATLSIDRDTAARLGISAQMIDNTLNDAFGQRFVATLFAPMNQYHVVMAVNDSSQQNPDALKNIYVQSTTGTQVPLSQITHYEPSLTALAVNHQGQFPAVTLSFNLAPGKALGDAVTAVEVAERQLGMPSIVQATFQGTAQAFQDSLHNQLLLISSAIFAVYIVLGMLYESFIHPITILSTLPSAGVGALLALLICHTELSVIAMIGIILLIGIVKKNAIMMVDFAVDAERTKNQSPEDSIYEACLLRFRPIMMTTMAALLGGIPLALGTGMGSELRRPLGIAIVGGLLVSQVLTLFTTPVIYLYMDRFRLYMKRMRVAPPSAALPASGLSHKSEPRLVLPTTFGGQSGQSAPPA